MTARGTATVKPVKLEAWATAQGQEITRVAILCRQHADELRSQLVVLRAAMRPFDATLFRVRHPAFLREFVATSPGCGECAIAAGRAAVHLVDGFKLTRDEMAREGALA